MKGTTVLIDIRGNRSFTDPGDTKWGKKRTTLYRARLIFGFEHLPPILGGPLRARKRFNYSRFVLLDLYELYLFNLYPACMYSLLDYIESLCGIATPLACLSLHKIYYSRFPSTPLLVFDFSVSSNKVSAGHFYSLNLVNSIPL